MASELATRTNGQAAEPPTPSALESVAIQGDLSKLTEAQRLAYYQAVCRSLGLNPLTSPFQYVTLPGRGLTLYATRSATDQLRALHHVSIQIVERRHDGDLYIVTARATLPDGRADEEIGVVNLAGLRGNELANGYMRTQTKAKRRATLSLVGLGWLDESEIETIAGAQLVQPPTEDAAEDATLALEAPDPEREAAIVRYQAAHDALTKAGKSLKQSRIVPPDWATTYIANAAARLEAYLSPATPAASTNDQGAAAATA